MRFKQFISEQDLDEFDLEKFLDECYPILKQYKRAGAFLYKGHPSLWKWAKIEFSQRSKPRDTPLQFHNAMNFNFDKVYGINPRNWQFGCFQPGQASMYGNVGALFPIDNDFDFVYSPKVHDATELIEQLTSGVYDFDDIKNSEKKLELSNNIKKNFVNEYGYVFTQDITQPLINKIDCEVMFKCEYYYLISDGKILNAIREKMRTL